MVRGHIYREDEIRLGDCELGSESPDVWLGWRGCRAGSAKTASHRICSVKRLRVPTWKRFKQEEMDRPVYPLLRHAQISDIPTPRMIHHS